MTPSIGDPIALTRQFQPELIVSADHGRGGQVAKALLLDPLVPSTTVLGPVDGMYVEQASGSGTQEYATRFRLQVSVVPELLQR